VFLLLVIARFTGMLQYYTIPTPSNHPAIKQGELVFTTNTKDAEPYKFIVFTSEYEDSLNAITIPDFKAGSHYLQRLCGTPGDVLEMKNGLLYVNNNNFDKGLNLCNQYTISMEDYGLLDQEDINTNESIGGRQITKDSVIVCFENTLLAKYRSKIRLTPYIIRYASADCFKWHDKNTLWTADNFGPLKLPSDCFFVLGDNRHNALDSRYTGFVKKDNIKGVVLNK
jgi:signal peptidase I